MALKPVLLALWGCGVGALVAPPARRLGQRSAVGVVGDRRVRVGARVSSERRFGAAHSKRQTFARRRLIVEAAPVEAPSITPPVVYEVYAQRWLQLGMLSLLAFISDLVCFATAAVPQAFEQATGHEAASLIDVFLFSNVFACFCFTDMAKRFGLRDVLVGAGIVMSVGCLLRSGVAADHLPPYACVVAGTILVGLAQPFFQCSPPLLSATWFPKKERALATATALNANQLGIAAAFVVPPRVVNQRRRRGQMDAGAVRDGASAA